MLRQAQEELRREQELEQEEQSRIEYVTVTQDTFRSDLSAASCASIKSIEDVNVEQLVHEPAITFYNYRRVAKERLNELDELIGSAWADNEMYLSGLWLLCFSGENAAASSKPFYRSRRFTSNQEEEELWS
jgi:hypothetical protein